MWQILLFLLCANAQNVHAEMFKCETEAGAIYYTDRTCAATDLASMVPCKTKALTPKDITKIEQQLQKSRNARLKRALQKKKQQQMEAKKLQSAQKRRERAQAKCTTLKRQIAEVNQKYKEGYTIKQGLVLDRKLAKYNEQRQIYCNE
jgi:hypothetical protein